MLTARRDSDPGAGAGGDHLLATFGLPGCDLDGSIRTRTVCTKIYENPTFGVKLGLKRHNQSSVPCSPALGDALSSWNQSESPKESKIRSTHHFFFTPQTPGTAAL